MPSDGTLHVAIRAAEMNDAAALAQLMCELGYETSTAEMRKRLDLILSDLSCRTLIAEVDNQICGMVGTVTHFSPEHNDLSGKIIALVVSNEWRRRGIGQSLLAAAERDFVNRGVKRVSLTTRFTRKQAHQFYTELGYAKTGFRFAKEL